MNLLIQTLNVWADHALRFAWPMLWQSSLLIGLLFALDLLMRRKLRPAVRYLVAGGPRKAVASPLACLPDQPRLVASPGKSSAGKTSPHNLRGGDLRSL